MHISNYSVYNLYQVSRCEINIWEYNWLKLIYQFTIKFYFFNNIVKYKASEENKFDFN